MTWTRARRTPHPLPNTGPIPTLAGSLPVPGWLAREIPGAEADRWFPWSPILASDQCDTQSADGTRRYVCLVPELPYKDPASGKLVKVTGVLWGPSDGRQKAEGGKLFRTPAPAKKFYEAITRGRIYDPMTEGL